MITRGQIQKQISKLDSPDDEYRRDINFSLLGAIERDETVRDMIIDELLNEFENGDMIKSYLLETLKFFSTRNINISKAFPSLLKALEYASSKKYPFSELIICIISVFSGAMMVHETREQATNILINFLGSNDSDVRLYSFEALVKAVNVADVLFDVDISRIIKKLQEFVDNQSTQEKREHAKKETRDYLARFYAAKRKAKKPMSGLLSREKPKAPVGRKKLVRVQRAVRS